MLARPVTGEWKGGAIDYDARTGAWSSTDRGGRIHPLRKSPFAQAQGNCLKLVDTLGEMPSWPHRGATIGHASPSRIQRIRRAIPGPMRGAI